MKLIHYLSKIIYKYDFRSAFNLVDLPANAELNVNDLISVSEHKDPKAKGTVWIPSDRYIKKTTENGSFKIVINSKFSYEPENAENAGIAFLPSQREYTFYEGDIRFRYKRDLNYLGIISTLISCAAIAFTFLTYLDQMYENDLSRTPVWIVSYNNKDNTLSFKSPVPEIQLLQGYFKLGAGSPQGKYLYMPDMKVGLDDFKDRMRMMYSKIPREKDAIIFGSNRIFDIAVIATRYVYKGEVRYSGGLYKLYVDAHIPSKHSKKDVEIIVRGASFHRFFNSNENIGSALNNFYTSEPTLSNEWIKLIEDTRSMDGIKK